MSAFVGADLVTALLASGLWRKEETSVLADIGTNGEMALYSGKRLYCCSTAAGPAFEGTGLSMGMAGKEGAIDRVAVQEGRFAPMSSEVERPRGYAAAALSMRCPRFWS